MSNASVGTIYQQIIRDVIESSRVDFEEGGVDESVMDELSRVWQQKLSQLGVAQFPWDPKPDPVPAAPPSSTNSSFQQTTPSTSSQSTAQTSQQSQPPANHGVRIKAEPGTENGIPQPGFPAGGPMTAQQRAAQHLQASYGDRASASISTMRAGMAQAAQPNSQYGQSPHVALYQQNMAKTLQQQQQRMGGANPVGSGQTDGADESGVVMTHVGASGVTEELGRLEIDEMIRQKIETMGRRMEGGGLMLPLERKRKERKRKAQPRPQDAVTQVDGGDDDEENDEDAINSDLDDSDDGLNEDSDDDEGMGHIMLCMYDKVQRVKNKWKCVMKDGVLTVNNKEYVFHKASGEYEW